MPRSEQISPRTHRRRFLRGVGAALILPAFESLAPRSTWAASSAKATVPPIRTAIIYVPNGVIRDAWEPSAAGASFDLSPSLQPLSDLKSDISVITGLTPSALRKVKTGGHAPGTGGLLTASVPVHGGKIHAGQSVDQLAAGLVGGDTALPSLQLGIHGNLLSGQCDTGYSCAYSSCISWRGASSPMPNDNEPRSVYERLFGKGGTGGAAALKKELDKEGRSPEERLKHKMLDLVLEDARRVSNRLGRSDRQKMEEYLYGVRQVEKRIEKMGAIARSGGLPRMEKPDGPPADYGDFVRLMGDLMVLAFQADLTRISTFMLGFAAGEQTYPQLGIEEGHHFLSHHAGSAEKVAKLRKIDQFNVDLYAYIVRQLRTLQEGEGTLLDHCQIFYTSGLGDGSTHSSRNLPMLVAGRAGGQMVPGKHHRLKEDHPLEDLWLRLLQNAGAKVPSFGTSTNALELS